VINLVFSAVLLTTRRSQKQPASGIEMQDFLYFGTLYFFCCHPIVSMFAIGFDDK